MAAHRHRVPRDYPGPVAAEWPELLAIMGEKVKGTRDSHSTAPWWQFERLRSELYAAIAGMDRVLVNSQVSNNLQFAFLTSNIVYAHTLYVFPFSTCAAFCTLQSRPHETWAQFLGSSMKDDLRYTPSDCFETFPFPDGWETHPPLEAAGQAYYEHRAALMVRNDEGMTKTYNRFHDPYEDDPEGPNSSSTVRKLNQFGINKLIGAENPCHYIPVRDAILHGNA